jgi:hypothetical protein
MPSKRLTRKTTKLKRPTTAVKRLTKSAKKLDLYSKHKNEYVASAEKPAIIRARPARYLSVRGRSAPGSDEFQRAIKTLYNVAFSLKMARKAAGQDYVVTKLEGLWSLDAPGADPSSAATLWNWELMIRVPPFITEKEVRAMTDELEKKGKGAEVKTVRLVDLNEGECVQMLHIGPYTAEKPTLDRMREFAEFAGRQFSGWHHEIYLSDPRRVQPEKLKTILRQPVA